MLLRNRKMHHCITNYLYLACTFFKIIACLSWNNLRDSVFQLSPFSSGETVAQEMVSVWGYRASLSQRTGIPSLAFWSLHHYSLHYSSREGFKSSFSSCQIATCIAFLKLSFFVYKMAWGNNTYPTVCFEYTASTLRGIQNYGCYF